MKKLTKHIVRLLLSVAFLLAAITFDKTDYYAYPPISVEFDGAEQSVIISGIPEKDANGDIYNVRGYLNYNGTRVETFCYGPIAYPYHVPERQAYIFNWKDHEFILPCSGDYQFTAYLTKYVGNDEISGPKTTITIHLDKQDESTNWGPGLPNTTADKYVLEDIQGTEERLQIVEDIYNWTIKGTDIVTVPDKHISLEVSTDPEDFPTGGVVDFFGYHVMKQISIDHDGELGFTAVLEYLVGTEYAGKYANLFYVAGDSDFEFVVSSLVDENGYASFTFTHASDYIIVITDEPYTGQDLNPQPEETETMADTNQTTDSNGSTADNNTSQNGTSSQGNNAGESATATTPSSTPILPLIAVGVVLVGGVIFFVKKKK